jgi:pimeloyl-ACP methyl ester carboxylesterase
MPFQKVNGLQVYYEIHGEGEVIMLLHHGFGCTRIWNDIYPGLVEQGYKVVMYDRRGFGKSEEGGEYWDFYESDRYRPESVEELRVIKEALDIGACHIVGQCEGGVVGVDYSVRHPEEVKTLTVASTQCFSEVPMSELTPARLVNKFRLLEPQLQAKVVEWHGERAEIFYDHFACRGGAYGCGYFDLRPILPSVLCPTLVLYPDRSSIFDVEQSVAFYRHLTKGELAVFPKCGHNTYEQRPEQYLKTVMDFIRRSARGEQANMSQSMTCLA